MTATTLFSGPSWTKTILFISLFKLLPFIYIVAHWAWQPFPHFYVPVSWWNSCWWLSASAFRVVYCIWAISIVRTTFHNSQTTGAWKHVTQNGIKLKMPNGLWLSSIFIRSSMLGLAARGVLFLILIAVVLHILDRQGEFVARTDFLWKAKLKIEQEEVETMRGINKVTLIKSRTSDWHFTSADNQPNNLHFNFRQLFPSPPNRQRRWTRNEKNITDFTGEYSTRSCCPTLFAKGSFEWLVSRELFMCCCYVRINTKLQRILRRNGCEQAGIGMFAIAEWNYLRFR